VQSYLLRISTIAVVMSCASFFIAFICVCSVWLLCLVISDKCLIKVFHFKWFLQYFSNQNLLFQSLQCNYCLHLTLICNNICILLLLVTVILYILYPFLGCVCCLIFFFTFRCYALVMHRYGILPIIRLTDIKFRYRPIPITGPMFKFCWFSHKFCILKDYFGLFLAYI